MFWGSTKQLSNILSQGSTISSITWHKDGKFINYTASHRYAVSRGGNRFVIALVTGGEDDGVFTCVVEQKNGNLYGSSASVKVEGGCMVVACSMCLLIEYVCCVCECVCECVSVCACACACVCVCVCV